MKKIILLVLLFISTIMWSQTVPKNSRLAITQNVKQNTATRVVVQDSITKELNWVLKSSLVAPVPTLQQVTTAGAVTTTSLTANSFIRTGGNASQFLKANGTLDSNTYLTSLTGAELLTNKQNSLATDVTNTKYPTVTAVNAGLATKQNTITNPVTGTGNVSYLSKFTGTNTIANSSWRETSTGARLFNGIDDGYNTFQLTGSAKISNTLKSASNYSPALSGTATYNIGVEGVSNGFGEGVNAISTNGVAGTFDIQSDINGNESNIAEFRDNGVVKASISDVGLANVNGLNSSDKITATSSIRVGDDTTPASQYNAGAIRYRSLAEVGYPEVNTQNSYGNYSWKSLWHSGNLNNLNQLTTRNFSDLQSRPTTLSGYGITDTPWTSYLPLSGGTLTGALTGTSGTFLSLAQTATGFSLGYQNFQFQSTVRFLWSSDGAFSGPKDIGLYRPSAGLLRIYDGATVTNLRDLNLRTLIAGTSVVVTGGTSSQFMKADGTLDSNAYALDSNVVHKTGNEIINGVKTFNVDGVGSTGRIVFNSTYSGAGDPSNSPVVINQNGNSGSYGQFINLSSTGAGLKINSNNSVGDLIVFSDNSQELGKVTSLGVLHLKGANFSGSVVVPNATIANQAVNLGQVQTTLRPYKVYTALLTQSGTSAPTAIVLENTLGGTVFWSYFNTGSYIGTLTGAFNTTKTTVQITRGNPSITPFTTNMAGQCLDNNSFGITTFSTTSYVDSQLSNCTLEVRVYN